MPSWRSRFLIPVYGFVVALVLTLGAGSVVSSAAGTADDLGNAQAEAADAVKQAKDARAERDAANRRVAELEAAAMPTTDAPPPDPKPGTKLIIRAVAEDGASPLAAAVARNIDVTYTVQGRPPDGGKLGNNGVWEASRPKGIVSAVCLRQPDRWKIPPGFPAEPEDTDSAVVCLDYTDKNGTFPPDKNFEVNFPLVQVP